jgi:hypothetical protein
MKKAIPILIAVYSNVASGKNHFSKVDRGWAFRTLATFAIGPPNQLFHPSSKCLLTFLIRQKVVRFCKSKLEK